MLVVVLHSISDFERELTQVQNIKVIINDWIVPSSKYNQFVFQKGSRMSGK